ncbi:MAG: DMT family transporter [Pseudomonadales bacterium]|nr:DMT family transporter [Pseudomonadales bacterium]
MSKLKYLNISGYWFGLIAVSIWTGFILVSRQGGVSPLLANDVIAIRYVTCALVVLPFWWFRYRFNFLEKRFVIASLIGGLTYALCAFRGFQSAPASHAAVLLPGTLPVLTFILAVLLNGERPAAIKWVGVGIISSGIGALIWTEIAVADQFNEGHGWFIGAALCWSLFTILVKRWNISPWQATVSLAVITCIVYLPAYLAWLPKNIQAASYSDILLQAFYQGILATIIQMLCYVRAVKTIGPSTMGSLMALVPLMAGLLAIPIFNEALSIGLVLGILGVSVGSWCVHHQWLTGPRRKKVCLT